MSRLASPFHSCGSLDNDPVMKRFAPILVVAMTALLLLFFSYRSAVSRSDALLVGRPEGFHRIDSRLCLFRSMTGHAGPGWDFAYDCDAVFTGNPLYVKTSLLGEPLATAPKDALAELRKPR